MSAIRIARRIFLCQLSAGVLAATRLAASAAAKAPLGPGPLRVIASPVPHAEILRYIKDQLTPGFDLKIIEMYGSIRPNELVAGGDADANFFQHVQYLQTQEHDLGIKLSIVAAVHIEPLGLYSRRIRRLDALRGGGIVAVPNDVTNLSRALYLLQHHGLLRLRAGLSEHDRQLATPHDVVASPTGLRIIAVDGPQLARSLDDVTLAVINGNYALQAGLDPTHDALAIESAEDNPYVNILVTTPTLARDPRVLRLGSLLTSEEVAQFIRRRYRGAVIPVRRG